MCYTSSYMPVNSGKSSNRWVRNRSQQNVVLQKYILTIPSTERVRNKKVWKKIAPERTFLLRISKRQLKFTISNYEKGGLGKFNPRRTYWWQERQRNAVSHLHNELVNRKMGRVIAKRGKLLRATWDEKLWKPWLPTFWRDATDRWRSVLEI